MFLTLLRNQTSFSVSASATTVATGNTVLSASITGTAAVSVNSRITNLAGTVFESVTYLGQRFTAKALSRFVAQVTSTGVFRLFTNAPFVAFSRATTSMIGSIRAFKLRRVRVVQVAPTAEVTIQLSNIIQSG